MENLSPHFRYDYSWDAPPATASGFPQPPGDTRAPSLASGGDNPRDAER
jgi:hypothetical protein